MSSRDVTVLGYLVLVLAGLVLDGLAVWGRAGIPTLEQVFTRIMRTRTGRVGVLAAWAWAGLHFFAR